MRVWWVAAVVVVLLGGTSLTGCGSSASPAPYTAQQERLLGDLRAAMPGDSIDSKSSLAFGKAACKALATKGVTLQAMIDALRSKLGSGAQFDYEKLITVDAIKDLCPKYEGH